MYAGSWPCARSSIHACAEWMPPSEYSTTCSVRNSGYSARSDSGTFSAVGMWYAAYSSAERRSISR